MEINTYVKEMLAFADEHSGESYDYPSLDYYFENGEYLKFYIQPKEYMMIPTVGFIIGGVIDGHTYETATFIPISSKKSLKTWITQVMENVEKTFNVTEKEVIKQYENLIYE